MATFATKHGTLTVTATGPTDAYIDVSNIVFHGIAHKGNVRISGLDGNATIAYVWVHRAAGFHDETTPTARKFICESALMAAKHAYASNREEFRAAERAELVSKIESAQNKIAEIEAELASAKNELKAARARLAAFDKGAA